MSLKKILRNYLRPPYPPEVIRILSGKDKDLDRVKQGTLEIVVVVVRGDTPEVVSERMSLVVEMAFKHGAGVDTFVSSMVVVVFGMPYPPPNTASRHAFAEELRQRLESDIKIIHCARQAVYGTFGHGGQRLAYTFMMDGFIEMLGQLHSMPFGEVMEFGASDARPLT